MTTYTLYSKNGTEILTSKNKKYIEQYVKMFGKSKGYFIKLKKKK